ITSNRVTQHSRRRPSQPRTSHDDVATFAAVYRVRTAHATRRRGDRPQVTTAVVQLRAVPKDHATTNVARNRDAVNRDAVDVVTVRTAQDRVVALVATDDVHTTNGAER